MSVKGWGGSPYKAANLPLSTTKFLAQYHQLGIRVAPRPDDSVHFPHFS